MKNNNMLIAFFVAAFAVPVAGTENCGVDFDGTLRGTMGGFTESVQMVRAVPVASKGYTAGNDSSVSLEPGIPVEWVTISGGKFLMGTGDFNNTMPVHEVTVNAFEISKSLVTVEQYAECVYGKRCSNPATYPSSYNSPWGKCNWSMADRSKHPINCITFEQASQYAAYMGARLPTEAEWEYAATGGGKNQKYPWGNTEPNENSVGNQYSQYNGSIQYETIPVCVKSTGNTLQGLCDMTGNVRQWVQDTYRNSYVGAPIDGSAVLDMSTVNRERVLRGAPMSSGAFGMLASGHRSDYRDSFGRYDGDAKSGYRAEIGFRLAKSIKSVLPIDWVTIPGGKFKMGTSGFLPGLEDTKPAHEVSIKTLEMSKTDVTVGQYLECVSKGKCTAPDAGEGCNWSKPGRQEHPVNCVDWNQANQYAEFAGARLPSEAEWEYAARSGGKDHTYPWGNSLPVTDLLVMNVKGTAAVCSRPAGNTEQGLCDMGGNVFQWVQDKYVNAYEGAPADGSPVENGGPLRALRGSSFNNANEILMRSVYRFATAPGYRYDFIGFRVAKSR